MSGASPGPEAAALERTIGELRPKLHRYCARMTGSVIDAEDVVQDALLKAVQAYPAGSQISNLEGWLFRIAHNAALDFLRRRSRMEPVLDHKDVEMVPDPIAINEDREIVAASLRTFMQLPVMQRSSVILMDVLGYTVEEISGIIDNSIPGVKAALHRGRAQLRDLVSKPVEPAAPVLAEPERSRLEAYAERFNARDFDALREMLADDVRLDLVNRTRRLGRKEVSGYFDNYSKVHDWQFVLGVVDRQPAVLVLDPEDAIGRPRYFVLLTWSGDKALTIRDFRYARYAIESAEMFIVEPAQQ